MPLYLSTIRGNHAHFRERDLNEREIVFIFLVKCMKGFVHNLVRRDLRDKIFITFSDDQIYIYKFLRLFFENEFMRFCIKGGPNISINDFAS